MAKKNAVVKTTKPAKVARPLAEKKPSTVKFESFSVCAVIPVMSYGNIQPKIEVKAESYEEAKAFVMPLIAELFKEYGEAKPTFLGKITEEVKVVHAPAQPSGYPMKTEAPAVPQGTTDAWNEPAEAPETVEEEQTQLPAGAKPVSVLKAENAINAASSPEAALAVQDQIEKSVKIPEEWKPYLIVLILKKRTSLKPAQ